MPIDIDTAKQFVSQNHRQGMPKQCPNAHSYGLYHEDDIEHDNLLGVVIFSSPRTKAKRKLYAWELLRMCFQDEIRVVGGASKLIKAFINDRNPTDFFTYQDTHGETTDVYSLSGMNLVKDAQEKRVLVKNGMTYDTAKNNRHDWFSFQQAQLGPDNLLGTHFGEMYDDENRRISNIDLFIQYCDYHIETIPGDREYAWHNPYYAFYTYKITATDSEKYYYGRKTLRKNSPEEKVDIHDCLYDGYYGSGGLKFQNWKNNHKDFLVKEVIGIYNTWGESVEAEANLIGNQHETDPLCLNSIKGGVSLHGGLFKRQYDQQECRIHGKTSHKNGICLSCLNNSNITIKHCDIHGDVYHIGNSCRSCVQQKSFWEDECETHGTTTHSSHGCVKCTRENNYHYGTCDIHGTARMTQYDECWNCVYENSAPLKEIKYCDEHGDTIHIGDSCMKCSVSDVYSEQLCPLHGMTKFRHGECVACTNTHSFTIRKSHCDDHGDVIFVDEQCFYCLQEKFSTLFEILESRKPTDVKKDIFTCPYCGEEFSSTINSVISSYLQNQEENHIVHSLCYHCKKKNKFLNNENMIIAKKYIPEWNKITPPITSAKDTRKVDTVCPVCGKQKTLSFLTLIRKIRQGKACCQGEIL